MAFNFFEADAQKIEDEVLTQLTDSVDEILYPGDERMIFGDAVAMVTVNERNYLESQAQQRFLQNATGEVLDAHGAERGLTRLEPTPASDTIKFTLSAEQTRNVLIPQGTRVTPDGLVFFATIDNLTIASGYTTGEVVAECQEPGEDYNGIEAGTITTLVDPINYVSDVTNLYGTDGGDDGEAYDTEGDDHFRDRIHLSDFTESMAGTEDSYISKTLGADASIVDASLESPSACKIVIYPLLEGGQLPDSDILAKVSAVFNNSEKKNRIMTDLVTVQSPTQYEYDINIKYYVTPENEKAAVNLVEREGGMIDSYINWQCEKLGRSINPDALRRELMDNTDELGVLVERVDITAPTFKQLSEKQVAKFSGTLTVSHEVVTDR